MTLGLVVIDVQNEYFAPEGKRVVPDGEQGLANILRLLEAARTKSLPVYHVVHESLDAGATAFRSGTYGAEIHPSIQVLPGEYRILKHFPGSFTQTALEAYLRKEGVDTLIICGFMAQMCCDTTTRQARERGFNVWYVADGTGARDLQVNGEVVPHEAIHKATLATMAQMFQARVMSTDQVVAELGA